jgi:hypothetical protein
MNDLFLKFDPGKASFILSHGSDWLFLGSCFSDEIAKKARYSGFKCASNPFGTVFHPIPLARFLEACIVSSEEEYIFEKEHVFYSWDSNATICSLTERELRIALQALRMEWYQRLQNASVLFVTFGTAWAYRLSNGLVVANCHKQPHSQFTKELTEINELTDVWLKIVQRLTKMNPDLKIVFTVSPVRHSRDGLVENNQSKALLIELIRRLTLVKDVTYFPSYEIVNDQLRDYRFFKPDRVHPTDETVSIVWEAFLRFYTDTPTRKAVQEIVSYRKFAAHIPSQPLQHVLSEHALRCERMRNEIQCRIPEACL